MLGMKAQTRGRIFIFFPGKAHHMTPFRRRLTPATRRMAEDMLIRNLAIRTIDSYTYRVDRFAKHFGKLPDDLGPEEIRTFQLWMIQEKKCSWSSFIQTESERSSQADPVFVIRQDRRRATVGCDDAECLQAGGRFGSFLTGAICFRLVESHRLVLWIVRLVSKRRNLLSTGRIPQACPVDR